MDDVFLVGHGVEMISGAPSEMLSQHKMGFVVPSEETPVSEEVGCNSVYALNCSDNLAVLPRLTTVTVIPTLFNGTE